MLIGGKCFLRVSDVFLFTSGVLSWVLLPNNKQCDEIIKIVIIHLCIIIVTTTLLLYLLLRTCWTVCTFSSSSCTSVFHFVFKNFVLFIGKKMVNRAISIR